MTEEAPENSNIVFRINLYYIENKHYGISKLDFLNDLKNKLINNDLLIYNDKFKEYAIF